jgi:hypothetical protein
MTLREFLTALATDANQLTAFQANPDKAMQEAGLSPEEQELVKSQNEERIKQYLQASGEGGTFLVAVNSSQAPE